MKYQLSAEGKSGYPTRVFDRVEILDQEEIAAECAKSSARAEQIRDCVLTDAAKILGTTKDEALRIVRRRLEDFLRKNPDQALSLAFGRVAIPGHVPYGHDNVR